MKFSQFRVLGAFAACGFVGLGSFLLAHVVIENGREQISFELLILRRGQYLRSGLQCRL
jgi:hypothetical protein